jgi:hypothetical protein
MACRQHKGCIRSLGNWYLLVTAMSPPLGPTHSIFFCSVGRSVGHRATNLNRSSRPFGQQAPGSQKWEFKGRKGRASGFCTRSPGFKDKSLGCGAIWLADFRALGPMRELGGITQWRCDVPHDGRMGINWTHKLVLLECAKLICSIF